jgi:hypothetical protein
MNDGTWWMLTKITMDERLRWAERERLRRLAKEGNVRSGAGVGLLSHLRRRLRQTGRPVSGTSPAAVAEGR